MARIFGETSTTDVVLSGVNLRGKRVLVTGASSGLGLETARSLAAHGAQVVGAARDLKKADAATDHVRKDATAHGGSFEVIAFDLASLTSVRACAEVLLRKGEPFDVIFANAGVMATPFGHTEDGFETQFGTNYLGHFVLVNRIAPLLRTEGRLINLATAGQYLAKVDLEDPNFERTTYDPWVAYGRAKTANVLFAAAFDLRHRDSGVRAAAIHPGAIRTELYRHLDQAQLQALNDQFQFKTIPQGAATAIWAGFVAGAREIGGRFCENCHVSHLVPDEKPMSANSGGVPAYALDRKTAEALWRKSEELVGEHF